ncbi:MAG: hypothetical protein KGJ37_04090, partial [Verrucomicrobiota bacterium]|nr:hypothetical protein [Verrucomicrobiota bacterium]
SQIQDLQNSGDTTVQTVPVAGTASGSFVCTRDIHDLKPDMKEITLTSTWHGCNGQSHSAKLVTRYAKSGLYDYFYTSY